MKCEDCKDGYITLLLTKVKCETCDGKGFIYEQNTSCQDDEYYPLPLPEETTQLEMPWWHYINNDDADSQCS